MSTPFHPKQEPKGNGMCENIPDGVMKAAKAAAYATEANGDDTAAITSLTGVRVIARAILAQHQITDAMRQEMDKLWSMFVVQCESIEDRENPPADPRYAERTEGFYAGEKHAAKSIRRSVDHPKYNAADFPAYASIPAPPAAITEGN